MNPLQNIIIIGAGAMGLPVALKLAALPEIKLRIVADAERVSRYRRDGLFYNGIRCDLEYALPEELGSEAVDLAIVATKNGALPQVAELLKRSPLDSDTIILPILNGISARDFFSENFPAQTSLYGLFLGHASVRSGNAVTFDGCGKICFGEASNRQRSAEVAAIASCFEKALIDYETPSDMLQVMWAKYVLNIGVNQAQAYYRADYGTMQKRPELMEFARKLMAEAVAVAAASGINGSSEMSANAENIIMSMPPQVKTSMLQDVEAGRPTEVAAFAGTLCTMGKKFGIPTPYNRMILEKFSY